MYEKAPTEEKNTGGGSVLISKRWRLCFLLFLAYTVLLLHRANLSMAVVCMVRPPNDIYNLDDEFNSSCNHSVFAVDGLQNGISPTPSRCFFRGENGNLRQNFTTDEFRRTDRTSNKMSMIRSDTFVVDWDKSLRSAVLSAYFYGNLLTQIPGGKMVDTFGGKTIMMVAYVVHAISSLLTPVCIKTHVALAFIIRIIIGLASGVVVPVGVGMIGKWCTPRERAAMISVSGCGFPIGSAISFFTSGYLCAYGFDGGWPSIFYIHGIIAGLFAMVWWFQAFNTPNEHPTISQKELSYILEARKNLPTATKVKTPWRSILVSRPMWASIVAHTSFNWGFYTMLINVPTFMKELLLFDITQNAFYSALPFLCLCVSNILWAKVSLTILARRWLSLLAVRKLLTCTSLLGSSTCLVVVGHVTTEFRHVAVVLLCFVCVLTSMCFSGFLANHAEYAGMHSGTAYGISNCVSVVAAILAAILAGAMTPNGSQWEWQTVFYLSAGVSACGAIVFYFFSSATLEPWAETRLEITVNVDKVSDEMESLASNRSL